MEKETDSIIGETRTTKERGKAEIVHTCKRSKNRDAKSPMGEYDRVGKGARETPRIEIRNKRRRKDAA